MIEPPKESERPESAGPAGLFPGSFDPAYVEGAIKPFLLSSIHAGDPPILPMIDFVYTKEEALPAHMWGMLYDRWKPNMEAEGLSVFLQGYENRGPNNERKKIYYSALTPDLYAPLYADKVRRFFDRLFEEKNAGKPLMQTYYESYFDLYWDLHLGVTGEAIPPEVRQIGASFNAVIGFWFPTLQIVHDSYMRVRALRQTLNDWIDRRVQDVIEGKVPDAEKTFVYYWIKNGEKGENFRRKDLVFECFHNFLALSQWGNTLYNVMARLDALNGDPEVRSWFERTMTNGPDAADGSAFSALDRFVMELFRTISPNGGSLSILTAGQRFLGAGYSTIIHPHPEASRNPRQWSDPEAFDPDRYKTAPTSDQNDAARCAQIGLARCPFPKESFAVKDGRNAELTNSAFGAVYGVVEGQAYPVCDAAGYAPFGFGYRRCPGEFVTVNIVKDFLRKVWGDRIEFATLPIEAPEMLPVGPATVVLDNIGFRRTA